MAAIANDRAKGLGSAIMKQISMCLM
jgi:hypothetical protein